MRNIELSRFVQDLIDALVRFHREKPADVLKKVGAPAEVQRIYAEIYYQRGLEDPASFLGEGASAELVEAYVATLEQRPLKKQLAELQRGIEAATERGDHEAALKMMESQQTVVSALQRLDAEELPALEAASPPLRLVAPPSLARTDQDPDTGQAISSDGQDAEGKSQDALVPYGRPQQAGPPRRDPLAEEREVLQPDDIALDEDDDFAW